MSGSVGSGSVKPDSQPPSPWSHVEKLPRPPNCSSVIPAVSETVVSRGPRVLATLDDGRWALESLVASTDAPRPARGGRARPPRPAPPTGASGAELGPRIVPLS